MPTGALAGVSMLSANANYSSAGWIKPKMFPSGSRQ